VPVCPWIALQLESRSLCGYNSRNRPEVEDEERL
jgi:hypothetical protein